MLKRLLVAAATMTLTLGGVSTGAYAAGNGHGNSNGTSPPPGCVHNGHPYGPPCGPPPQCHGNSNGNQNCDKGDNANAQGDQSGGNGNQGGSGKNVAFVLHTNGTSSSNAAGETGLAVVIGGMSLAGVIALRKRPGAKRK